MARIQSSFAPLSHSPPTYSYPSLCGASAIPNRQLRPMRGTTNLSMSSFLLIMLLSVSLATSFCEGRTASFLHSRKGVAKVKVKKTMGSSSITEGTVEKTDRAIEIDVQSINYKSDRKEDKIRGENSSSYVQKSNIVAVSRHEPSYTVSEEKLGYHLDYAVPHIHPPSHN